MKKTLILLLLLSGFVVSAYAQQDPDDPGMQDSLIIGEVSVDSGQTFAFVQLFMVTDDTVGYFNTPIRWDAPGGRIFPGTGTQYFPPFDCWDHYDTVLIDQSYIRHFSYRFDEGCYYIYTHGLRLNFWTIRFIILPDAPRQLVVLDTTWDDRIGSIVFGLIDGITEITPAVVRGYIGYGVGVDNDIDTRPKNISLSQNYPNPFNSSTVIQFSLPSAGPVSLMIYDIQGREIRRLIDSDFDTGNHSVVWNSIDNSNKSVSSGIYFYRLTTDDATQTNRMTLLR